MMKARMVRPLQIMMRDDFFAWMVAAYSYFGETLRFVRVREMVAAM